MYNKIISLIFILGISFHAYVIQLNNLVKTPDGFANIQMIDGFKNLSLDGFGTGWLGFLYSMPIAGLDVFLNDQLLSAQIINTLLLLISGILIFKLGNKYLHPTYNSLLIILFFLSSTILSYNLEISIQNMYMPLFLGLILAMHKLMIETSIKSMVINIKGINVKITNHKDIIKKSIYIGFILSLLYFTLNEAFIYIFAILLTLLYLNLIKKIDFPTVVISFSSIIITFFIIISPFIYYLYTITGKIQITNKIGSSITQIQIINNGGDLTKAQGLLTEDKQSFVSGFSSGLNYQSPENNISIFKYLINDPGKTLFNFFQKQKVIITKTIPEIILGDVLKSYEKRSFIFYENKIILFLIYTPLIFLFYGLYRLLFTKIIQITAKRNFLIIVFPLFLITFIFSSLFFIENKYLIVFLPIFLLIICYGAETTLQSEEAILSATKFLTISFVFISIFLQGALYFYTYNKYNDEKYMIKKDMGIWLKENTGSGFIKNPKIMEVLPIVTYYSGTKERWLTPDTDNLKDLLTYAKYNKIDYFVVDLLDFNRNRSDLNFLLKNDYKNDKLEKIHEIKKPGEKVILYKFIY